MANSDMCLKVARKVYPNNENLRVAYMLGFNDGFDKAKEQQEADLEKEIEQAGKDVIRQAHYHNKIFNIPQNIFDDVQLMDIFKAGVYKACELGFNARK